jgi:acyl carrier protein
MSTLETVQDILITEYALTRDRLAPEVQLAALGVDSLGLIEVMFQIEDRFGITVPDDKPPVLVTLSDVVEYVDGLVVAQSAAPRPEAAPSAFPVT